MANERAVRVMWWSLVLVSPLVLTGCAPMAADSKMTASAPRLEEGVVRLFDVSLSAADDTGQVWPVDPPTPSVEPLTMMVVPFTPDVQAVIDGARTGRRRVVGYVRCDSSGVPRVGVVLPEEVDVNLPAGPGYRQYQQLVVLAAMPAETD